MSFLELNADGPPRASLSSPLKRSRQGSHRFQSAPTIPAKDVRKLMVHEMDGLWVGPMPVSDFLQEFLPKCVHSLPTIRTNLFASVDGKTKEKDMYAPFIQVLTDNQLIPGYKVVDTSNHSDINSRTGRKIRPDPSMYEESLPLKNGITRFDELELNFELKLKNSQDPFRDPKSDGVDRKTHQFTAGTLAGQDILGQLTGYAAEWCSLQYRTFAFTVYIFGSYARFIRWDRSGAVISEKFNYQTDPNYLAIFLWRFVHLKPEDRGRDITVRKASPEETQFAQKKLKKWNNHNTRSPVVFTVKEGDVDREFIGWGSMADAESLTGRATRAYPVWNINENKLCFLKDTWRAVTLEGEAKTIRELNREGVRYVPTVVCGGDIEEHTTKTQMFAGNTEESSTYRSWRCHSGGGYRKDIVARIHHRFVVNFVGQPLTSFPSTFIMLQAVFHAYIAHQEAYVKCRILHRDISAGNIMLDDNGDGILNDWDLAKHIPSSNEVEIARPHERTGTWQFISALMLMYPGKQHVLQDDIESFAWVILYVVLRYTKTSIPLHKLQGILVDIFDGYRQFEDGVCCGGRPKEHLCSSPMSFLGDSFKVIKNPPLTKLIPSLLKALNEWHLYDSARRITKDISHDDMQDNAGRPKGFRIDPRDLGHIHALGPRQPTLTPTSEPQTLQLNDHKGVHALLANALTSNVWPDGDKTVYNLSSLELQGPKRKRSKVQKSI